MASFSHRDTLYKEYMRLAFCSTKAPFGDTTNEVCVVSGFVEGFPVTCRVFRDLDPSVCFITGQFGKRLNSAWTTGLKRRSGSRRTRSWPSKVRTGSAFSSGWPSDTVLAVKPPWKRWPAAATAPVPAMQLARTTKSCSATCSACATCSPSSSAWKSKCTALTRAPPSSPLPFPRYQKQGFFANHRHLLSVSNAYLWNSALKLNFVDKCRDAICWTNFTFAFSWLHI